MKHPIMNNDWVENTGSVPEGVGPDTVIEVEYRCGDIDIWDGVKGTENCHPALWSFDGYYLDVIRWRFVKENKTK